MKNDNTVALIELVKNNLPAKEIGRLYRMMLVLEKNRTPEPVATLEPFFLSEGGVK